MKSFLAILFLSASVAFGQPTLANSDDITAAKARANHTGTQPASTISDSTTAGRAILTAANAAAQRDLLAPSYASWTRATKVALLGDSITTLDTYSSVSNRKFYHSWTNWMNIFLGNRLTWAYNPDTDCFNFGVGGNTAEQILARVPDVLATDADTVMVMAGANNMLSGDTHTTLAPKVIAIWDAIIAGGKQVIALEILPLLQPAKNQYVNQTNALLKVAAEARGIPFVVWGSAVRDGPYAKYDLFTNGALTDIGVHPGLFGGPVIGRIAAEQLDPYIQATEFAIPAAGLVTAAGDWVTPNAYMTSGGSGSTAPTGFSASNFASAGAPAVSKVEWLTSNWFKCVVPAGPSTGGTNMSVYQAGASTGLVNGDWVRPVARIIIEKGSHFNLINFNASFVGDSSNVGVYGLFDGTGTTAIYPDMVHDGALTGIIVGPKVQVTALAAAGDIYCTLTLYGYGTAMVSQMGLIKTTAP